MTDTSNQTSFEQVVEWAYSTLPEKIRNLPDFPGIQVADEPPEEMLARVSKSRNRPCTELLGCYSGISRTRRQHNLVPTAPELIFVFKGPILRHSKGNLPGEVKQVVWHEVAHWLGHDEEEVKELGLSRAFDDIARDPLESEAPHVVLQQKLAEAVEKEEEANQQLRCIKCYSADVTSQEVERPLSYAGANSFDPVTAHVHVRRYTCNSCGYEWDDEDTE
jgi:predicted Zn-dependent protease with MMP-like domain